MIDRVRRRKRAPDRVFAAEDEEGLLEQLPCVSRESDPEQTAELAELQVHVRAAIATLPPKLRAVVVLHDMEGCSYEEAAQAVGCPVGTVKSRLFNARAALKRKLSAYMEG